MIKVYTVKREKKYVPKVRGQFLEFVPNLGIYVRTKDPHKATRVSTREKAERILKEYRHGSN